MRAPSQVVALHKLLGTDESRIPVRCVLAVLHWRSLACRTRRLRSALQTPLPDAELEPLAVRQALPLCARELLSPHRRRSAFLVACLLFFGEAVRAAPTATLHFKECACGTLSLPVFSPNLLREQVVLNCFALIESPGGRAVDRYVRCLSAGGTGRELHVRTQRTEARVRRVPGATAALAQR